MAKSTTNANDDPNLNLNSNLTSQFQMTYLNFLQGQPSVGSITNVHSSTIQRNLAENWLLTSSQRMNSL